jgi:GT2 family glycosyltransferase
MAETLHVNPVAKTEKHLPPALSVVIPTCNRRESLLRVLTALAEQRDMTPKTVEVALADDGSIDGTVAAAREWSAHCPLRVKILYGTENRGPAHARNRAIDAASASLLVIIGDDILPSPHFLAGHLRWHREHPEETAALLGLVVWPDTPRPTPFMRWLQHGGRSFYFDFPLHAGSLAPDRFYTCNVSVKRSLIQHCGGFDETFPFASHEDIEIGLRMAKRGGMRLHFEPGIVATHDHVLTLESMLRRVYLNGYSSIQFWDKVRDDSSALRRAGRKLCKKVAGLCPPHLIRRRTFRRFRLWWPVALSLAYWRGAADAANGRKKPSAAFMRE